MKRWKLEERDTFYDKWETVMEITCDEETIAGIAHDHYGFRTGLSSVPCPCQSCQDGWMISNDWMEYESRYVCLDGTHDEILEYLHDETSFAWTVQEEEVAGSVSTSFATQGKMRTGKTDVQILMTNTDGNAPTDRTQRILLGFYTTDGADVVDCLSLNNVRDAVLVLKALAVPMRTRVLRGIQ